MLYTLGNILHISSLLTHHHALVPSYYQKYSHPPFLSPPLNSPLVASIIFIESKGISATVCFSFKVPQISLCIVHLFKKYHCIIVFFFLTYFYIWFITDSIHVILKNKILFYGTYSAVFGSFYWVCSSQGSIKDARN